MSNNLNENYYLRKYYFQHEQVPTQSMMKNKMTPPLAAVYFKSMTPKLKVIAGLEPPLRGGGSDWYVPPKEILEGRTVLKPITKDLLKNWNHIGIDTLGMKLFKKHRVRMDLEIEKALWENDINWRNIVTKTSKETWQELADIAKKKNIDYMTNAFNSFAHLYRLSLQKIESLFHEGAIAEIKKTREKALHWMQNNYAAALHSQATTLYDAYENKLTNEKARLKAEFINNLEINRTEIGDKLHDLYVDKHIAIEKLRQFLQCQVLACQIYVALKEREECMKEMEESKHKHEKKVKTLDEQIAYTNVELHIVEQKDRRRKEFSKMWQKKVCLVVKKFQTFVSYCLNMLPEHAEFFINMEKLMLLQVNETLENPSAESIIIIEQEKFHTPVPRPKPFYLFCDRGYKAQVDENLCRKRSESHLPVIIVNKRCLYGACDNFELFTDRIKDFIRGERGDEAYTRDDQIYEHYVPVKYTMSQQLLELKLESSLLQILQEELPNMRDSINDIPVMCGVCKLRHCMCSPWDIRPISTDNKIKQPSPSTITIPEIDESTSPLNMARLELEHEREPKWESYFQYVEPKKCSCAKMAKKHLAEHMPPYMRHMTYGPPEIPNYETCPLTTLRNLVKEASKKAPPVPIVTVPSKTKDVGTQCFDPEFEFLCTCFSDGEVPHLFSMKSIEIDPTGLVSSWADENRFVGGDVTPTYLTKNAGSFATARAYSLKNIVEDAPELQEIFKKVDCI